MPSLSRRSQSRSASIRSNRPSHRDTAQQTPHTQSSRRRRSASSRNSSHHRTPSPSPTRPLGNNPDRKRFGLHAPSNPTRIGKFDFEEKYPEDPIYEELGPNARAWRVNLDECEVYDNDMVIEARDGLDLLLVFAGLFSAVLTTFVVQTSQALSNNFPAVSTSLLLEMVTLQRALINGTPVDDISASEMTSGPSGFDIGVNVLWFMSLTLSLGTALMAVLVKQWLYQYMSITSGTARDRSLIRFYRFNGLRKWHVLTIIGTLPIVLHVALALFLAGLVVFLIPLNVPLASIVGIITAIIYTMYTVSNILPIIYTQCPYRTPFSDILNILMRPIIPLLSFIAASATARVLRTFLTSAVTSVAHLYRIFATLISDLFGGAEAADPSTPVKVVFPTLKEAERIAATGDEVAEGIGCDALVWLYQMTSNPPTKSIILQSLGCLSDDVSDRLVVVHPDLRKALEEVIHHPHYWSILPGQESRAGRILRAQRHIKEPQVDRSWWEADPEAFSPPFDTLVSILTYAPTGSVASRGGEYRNWSSSDLLMHIMQEYSARHPILLPPTLWQQYMPMIRQLFDVEDTKNRLLLCQLALLSWGDVKGTRPFSGGEPITRSTVLLDHVINMLPHNDLPDSDPLYRLCIMNDYIASELSTSRNLITDDAISLLLNIWNRIPGRGDGYCSLRDSKAICQRAEKCILEVFVGNWWDGPSDPDVLNQCYSAIVTRYWWHGSQNSVAPSPELFTKLFSEICWWAVMADATGETVCEILEHAFSLDVQTATAYYYIVCGSESPLFSPRTNLPLSVSRNICRVMTAFVSGLDHTKANSAARQPALRGRQPRYLPPTRHCMEFLCAEPDRLFAVCRVLALGTDDFADSLSDLVCLDPKRNAWLERNHFLVGIEPWDWTYFLIPKDHKDIVHVRARMQFALHVLDSVFALLDIPPNLPPHPPPKYETGPAVRQSSVSLQSEPVSPWRRIRQLVSSVRVFQKFSPPVDSVELGSPPGQSNDRSSQMESAISELRHSLAMKPLPLRPLNAAAGPSSSHGAPPEDRMV